jgi:glycosyltransferase involved in cell wall biosynthesis
VTDGPKIVFIQYTNPASLPPLEHASGILADRGWNVLFLGAAAQGADDALRFASRPAVRVRRIASLGSGMLLKMSYAAFIIWALASCIVRRPHWLYVSEPISALPALILQRVAKCNVVYHEHDTPSYAGPNNAFQRLLRSARTHLARRADLCVLPQEGRLRAFVAETGRKGPTLCVWNTPRQDDVAPPRPIIGSTARPLRLYYHGTLNRYRLPLAVLEALAQACSKATLTIVGYETAGSAGYMQQFMRYAAQLGIGDRVIFRGPLSRAEMLREASRADVGLALIPYDSSDINMQHMVGASVKPFDYLAVGLMLLVSDSPDWRRTYVEPGFARACDPVDAQSLADAFAWCVANPDEVRTMGERGRQMIEQTWNYERCFAPVAEQLAATETAV